MGLGLRGRLIGFLNAYLEVRSYGVKLEAILSDPMPLKIGLP